jgi:hypothetical protein
MPKKIKKLQFFISKAPFSIRRNVRLYHFLVRMFLSSYLVRQKGLAGKYILLNQSCTDLPTSFQLKNPRINEYPI